MGSNWARETFAVFHVEKIEVKQGRGRRSGPDTGEKKGGGLVKKKCQKKKG